MARFYERGNSGFTTVEIIVATAMLMVLMMIMVGMISKSVDSYRALTLQSHMQHNNRVALDAVRAIIAPSIGINPLDSTEQLVDVFTVEPGEFDLANDTNGNGLRDVGEAFEDTDGDTIYDGPIDAVLLTLANALPEEPFDDINGNGVYDVGEPFNDMDNNGAWTDTNGNGVFDETFRTYTFPVSIAGEPDPHSLTILAPYTTDEGHRQLRQYFVYRTERDLDGDGEFLNIDTNGDGIMDIIEDGAAATGLPWDPPYVIDYLSEDVIALRDKSNNGISIDRATGAIQGAAMTSGRQKDFVVLCNDLHYFDIALDIDAQPSVIANVQLALLTNVESFNVQATGKGRVYSTLTTGVWINN